MEDELHYSNQKHFSSKQKVLCQFFTPSQLAQFMIKFCAPYLSSKEAGCDPACGEGVFLEAMIQHGFKQVIGIDIDPYCISKIPSWIKSKVLILVEDALRRSKNICDNSSLIKEEYFDLVIGNPPFSSKYGRVKDKSILDNYELGINRKSQAIEVLFLERFFKLAKPKGVIAIILPDGIFSNLNYIEVRKFIMQHSKILGVISLPKGIFNSSAKTCCLFLLKSQAHIGKTYMAEVQNINQLEEILKHPESIGFWVEPNPNSLHPKHYLPINLQFKFPTSTLENLVEKIVCGSKQYGSKRKFSKYGIKLISAKVVTPFGLDFSRDLKFIQPESCADKLKSHVKIGDIVFVRVGEGSIGKSAVITDNYDIGIVNDWIFIIRPDKTKITPYYLALFLQSKYGKIQIDRFKRGVATVSIPKRLLKQILVPVVPMKFQLELEPKYLEMVKLTRETKYDQANQIFKELISKVESYISN